VAEDLTRPASLLRCLGAMLYDSLIVLALWLVTLFVVVAVAGRAVVGPTLQSLLFIELFAFFTASWVLRGQTVGMLAWHLTVVTSTGMRLTWQQALRRFIGAALAFATFGLGYLWKFIDPGRRTWPDLLSGTEIQFTPRG
jgi:uncharacterized RDD family membrane protein YckC